MDRIAPACNVEEACVTCEMLLLSTQFRPVRLQCCCPGNSCAGYIACLPSMQTHYFEYGIWYGGFPCKMRGEHSASLTSMAFTLAKRGRPIFDSSNIHQQGHELGVQSGPSGPLSCIMMVGGNLAYPPLRASAIIFGFCYNSMP